MKYLSYKKQFEFIYLETSNNPIWNNDEFDTWAGNIGRDLSYSIIQDNLDSIDQSLNSIYNRFAVIYVE